MAHKVKKQAENDRKEAKKEERKVKRQKILIARPVDGNN
jgi:hypothetical protein